VNVRSLAGSSLPVAVAPDADAAGRLVAERIIDLMEASDGDRPFYLAGPAGRTPTTTYAAFGRIAARRGVDLSRLVVVMMDEYVHEGPSGFQLCDPSSHYSCVRYFARHLRDVVNEHMPVGRSLADDQIRCPDPSDPASIDRELDRAGGADVFLLASGASDGHVAFNPPGTPLESSTRVEKLARSTRRDNLSTFPAFGSLDSVPTHGVTIGLASVTRARHAMMLLLGAQKRDALGRLLGSGDFDPQWPATVAYRCNDPVVVVDEAAAG
jgi:glucosamine-6-phosphate deaminase